MPIFLYKAKNQKTETVTGQINADNKDDAIEKINQLGLLPITIETQGSSSPSAGLTAFRRVSIRELYHFSRQLAGLLKAGISLIRALQIMESQQSNIYFQQIINNICAGVRDGRAFADCLSEHPKVFSSLYTAMVRAGEESGNLQEMLSSLAAYYRKQSEFISKVKAAMAYPIIMMILGAGTVFFILTFVMPRITGLFVHTQAALPLPTVLLLRLSEVLAKGWSWIAIFILATVFFYRRWIRSTAGHLAWSRFQLKLPWVGAFIVKIELALFFRTLELLLKSGIAILRAMSLSIPLINNDLIKADLTKSQDDLSAGGSLGQSIKASKTIPKMLGDIVTVGEESGSVATSLQDIADTYEQETEEFIKIATTLLEPLMILLVGSAVGFIVFAILLPIFQMEMFS
ncbi:MAG: type II secretion system F family protein [Candidatus Omnitrophota bacterium]